MILPEHSLILLGVRPETSEEDRKEIDGLLSSGLQWDRFLRSAGENRVSPLLYLNLAKGPHSRNIPGPVIEQLRTEYVGSRARNMNIFHQFGEMARALRIAGIPFLPLKGIDLAGRIYPDVGVRPMSDIDLFVDAAFLDRGLQVLEPWTRSPLYLNRWHRRWMEANKVHAPQKISRDGTFKVELHHDKNQLFSRAYFPLIAPSRSSSTTGGRDEEEALLPPHRILLMTALHFSTHVFALRHGFLIWCCDGAWTIHKYRDRLDWNRLFEEEDRPHAVNRLGHFLRFLEKQLGVELPGPVPEPVPLKNPDLFNDYQGYERIILDVLFGAGSPAPRPRAFPGYYGPWERLRYLLAVLFPSREYIRQRYGLAGKGPVAWMYVKRLQQGLRRFFPASGGR